MNRSSRRAGLAKAKKPGAHRVPRKQRSVATRTAMAGGAAVCIGLLAEVNLPDAHALAILLAGPNGTATQINILEGNIIDPQFNPFGNVSHNTTIGSIMLGGNPVGGSHVIALGGATADSGNVTQVNVLSYNIINPQASIFGDNSANNTTISNVSALNGNGQPTSSASGLFGPATGAGNTDQIAFLSGNILSPQFSLFGTNTSNNLAITNLSALNGNLSPTSSTGLFGGGLSFITGAGNTNQVAGGAGNIINPQFSALGSNNSTNIALTNQSFFNGNGSPTDVEGDGLGTFLVGMTGAGNTNQIAGLVSNIANPQGTFGGYNASNNIAGSNNAAWNGWWSDTDVSSTNGGNNTVLGSVGAGNVDQIGNGNGSVWNDQLRLFTGLTQPGQTTGNSIQQNGQQVVQSQGTTDPAPPTQTGEEPTPLLSNSDVLTAAQQGSGTQGTGSGTGTGSGNPLLLLPNGQPSTSTSAGSSSTQVGQKIADAVKKTTDAVKEALKPKKPSTDSSGASGSN
jgi:hypothetical protein